MHHYLEALPLCGETELDYARRLEDDGHDEMFIRKALRAHFDMEICDLADFFEAFETARFRHIAQIAQLVNNPCERALTRKVSVNLGINKDCAAAWVKRFRANESKTL